MSAAGLHIDLLVPGLEGPVSDHPIGHYLDTRPGSLDRLLSRAQASAADGEDLESVLLRGFGLDASAAIAPLTCLADTGQAPPGYVMRADPVHLRADQSCVRLFDTHSFDIDRHEADALVSAFNTFYADAGMRLEAPVPDRWYLHADPARHIDMPVPGSVAGQDIFAAMPHGDAARAWHVLLNEVQMLFHTQEVNLAREQQGRPVINSLWPWGGGVLTAGVSTRYHALFGHAPLARALAGCAGIDAADPGMPLTDILRTRDHGNILVIVDDLDWPARYNEIEKWLDALQRLEAACFGPLLDGVTGGHVQTLRLLPCNGSCYTVTRKQLRGFWRRVRPFERVFA